MEVAPTKNATWMISSTVISFFFLSCMRCLFVNVGFVDFDFVAFDDLGLCLLLALRFLLGKVSIFAGIPNFRD